MVVSVFNLPPPHSGKELTEAVMEVLFRPDTAVANLMGVHRHFPDRRPVPGRAGSRPPRYPFAGSNSLVPFAYRGLP